MAAVMNTTQRQGNGISLASSVCAREKKILLHVPVCVCVSSFMYLAFFFQFFFSVYLLFQFFLCVEFALQAKVMKGHHDLKNSAVRLMNEKL
jgi:hypothetical protein